MSQYLQRLNIASVEEVGVDTNLPHYTQHVDVVEVVDNDGNPWEPVPGPDPWDELVVNEKPLWHVDNIYEEGNTLTATTGPFIGGNPENTVYRWRFQTRVNPEDAWVNSSWTNYPNDLQQVSYPNAILGQIRLQIQARDATTDPENVVQVNSFTATKTVEPVPTNIGTISMTVNDLAYDTSTGPTLTILMNDPIPCVASISGDASPSYTWDARDDYPVMIGSQTASTILTFPSEGFVSVTCTVSDPNSVEKAESVIINFFVVDAFD